MAGASIEISATLDDRDLQAAMEALKNRLQPAARKLAFQDMGEYLLASHKDRFDQQIAPDGTPWEPLSPATLAARARAGLRKGKGGRRQAVLRSGPNRGRYTVGAARNAALAKILIQRGYLRGHLRYQASETGLQLGSNLIYAATHHFGDDDRKIPARPFLGLSGADREELRAILHRHFLAAVTGA